MNRFIASLRLIAVAGVAIGLTLAPALSYANAGKDAQKKDEGVKSDKPKQPKKKTPPKDKDDGKVGYSETEIQLKGMMVPMATGDGSLNYQVVMLRLQVAPGINERAACFMAPVVHEKLLMYMHTAGLKPEDFTGERRAVLIKNLLDVAIKTTDRSFYSGVMLIDAADAPPLDAKSQTLSSQCS